MHPILRNVLAVIAGVVLGGLVNIGLVMISASVIPPPAGVDVNDPGSIAGHIGEFQPKHFLFPFLAHALGTLTSAYVAARLAATRKRTFAWVFGVLGLLGGIMAARMIPAPTWFLVLDLTMAYLPMAWIGGKWGSRSAS